MPRVGEGGSRTRTGWRDAKKELLAITQEDPANAEAYYLLGILYKQVGGAASAAAMFRKTLLLRPRHPGALAEVQGAEPTSGDGPPSGSASRRARPVASTLTLGGERR